MEGKMPVLGLKFVSRAIGRKRASRQNSVKKVTVCYVWLPEGELKSKVRHEWGVGGTGDIKIMGKNQTKNHLMILNSKAI